MNITEKKELLTNNNIPFANNANLATIDQLLSDNNLPSTPLDDGTGTSSPERSSVREIVLATPVEHKDLIVQRTKMDFADTRRDGIESKLKGKHFWRCFYKGVQFITRDEQFVNDYKFRLISIVTLSTWTENGTVRYDLLDYDYTSGIINQANGIASLQALKTSGIVEQLGALTPVSLQRIIEVS